MTSFKPPMVFCLVLVVFGVFVSSSLHSCLAASGGRMGGSASSSSSSSSSSSTSSAHYYYYGNNNNNRNNTSTGDRKGKDTVMPIMLGMFVIGGIVFCTCSCNDKNTCILILQVACSRMAESLQEELTLTARHTDTTQTEVSSDLLLNNINHCISVYSSVYGKLTISKAHDLMNQLSGEERQKFDVETIINIDGIQSEQPSTVKADGSFEEDFIVVTILVSVRIQRNLPTINDRDALKEALIALKSIQTSEISQVLVLWTPQNKDDSMFEPELKQKYPNLRQLETSQ